MNRETSTTSHTVPVGSVEKASAPERPPCEVCSVTHDNAFQIVLHKRAAPRLRLLRVCIPTLARCAFFPPRTPHPGELSSCDPRGQRFGLTAWALLDNRSGHSGRDRGKQAMKRTNRSLSIAALAAISLPPCLFGQDDSTTKPAKVQPSPDYCSMSKILGAKVRMNRGSEAKGEAQKDGEATKGPEGKIDDVLIDAQNGSLQYAVLSFGGLVGIGDKTVAVPCSALTWNQPFERFELAASEDRLKAVPAFDLGKARKTGLDNACNTAHAQWRTATGATTQESSGTTGEVKEATMQKKTETKPLTGTSFFLIPNRFLCATEIEGFPVYTTSEKFGKISDLLVDRREQRLALAIVKHGGTLGIGGTEYLVPFRVLHTCTSGEERVLCLNCEPSSMETAVVYEKPKDGIVDSEAAKRALGSTGLDRGIDKASGQDKSKDEKGR